jgi:ABC-2 type transport system permease protein
MRRLWDYYRIQGVISVAVRLQYRVALMIWMIEIVLEPTIYLVVWQTAAGDGSIAGYDARGFAAYYIAIMIVQHITNSWEMYEYEYYINQGYLSGVLLRPFHPIHEHIVGNISYKLMMLVILIPAVIIVSLIFQPAFDAPTWAVLAFFPALILGGALAFLMGYVVALAAFWTVRTMAINNLYYLVMLFCSGQLAPLDVLPAPLQAITSALPFRWMVSFPVETLLGRLTPQETLLGFGAQVAWLAVIYGLFQVAWRESIRHYGAVNG